MSQIPTSPLPPLPLNKNKEVVYTVRTIWEWVFEVALSPSLPHVLYHDLPSVPSSTVEGKGGKKRRRRPDRPALARFEWYEVGEEDGEGKEKGERKGEAWWCVSGLMDPLRHKDLLVKSLSFSSLQWATPPSLLFPPTPEEIEELMEKVKRGEKGGFEVWEDVETPVPPLKWFREKLGVEGPSSSYSSPSSLSPSSSPSPLPRYVLKPPMGCQGEGIQFVENLEEGLPDALADAISARQANIWESLVGRKPHWVAQKLVDGMTLGGKKFHLRAHVVVLEGVMVGEGEERGEGFEFYAHLDYEVRIAALKKDQPFSEKGAHITNGAGGCSTRRAYLSPSPSFPPFLSSDSPLPSSSSSPSFCDLEKEFPEAIGLSHQLTHFLSSFFSSLSPHLSPLGTQEGGEHSQEGVEGEGEEWKKTKENVKRKKWGLLGLDLMVDTQGRVWLLEVNGRPGVASRENLVGNEGFGDHLVRLVRDIYGLVVAREVGERFVKVGEGRY